MEKLNENLFELLRHLGSLTFKSNFLSFVTGCFILSIVCQVLVHFYYQEEPS
jgi:hypothetical protein